MHWQAYSLPIVLRRNVSLESNDEQLKGEASKRTSPIGKCSEAAQPPLVAALYRDPA